MSQYVFPKGFVWGTATSAYQIEGASDIDGKGPSIWDEFCKTGKKIKNGDSGALGCDHYNLFENDISLMQKLNYRAYRFSISWPRVLPTGSGEINPKGLDFYDRLIDKLLKSKINPFVTLYHWDLPLALEKSGGWMNRETSYKFAEYSELIIRKFGDRVKNWITINEPWIIYVTGYMLGMHAPGKICPYSSLRVAHNLLLAHGLAVERIRGFNKKLKVGITNALSPVDYYKLNGGIRTVARADAFQNALWMDPIFKGRYPAEIEDEVFSQNKKNLQPEDMRIISQKTDFLGLNHYTRTIVRSAPIPLFRFFPVKPKYRGVEFTSMGWEIYPLGIRRVLEDIRSNYGNPEVFITENGVAFQESPDETGYINDTNRINYLSAYLKEVHRAIQDGSRVSGYFLWSFLDNFEWQEGYAKTFGLVYVDRKSGRFDRVPKASAHWYSQLIRQNKLSL
jgi:beta-glucosidase